MLLAPTLSVWISEQVLPSRGPMCRLQCVNECRKHYPVLWFKVFNFVACLLASTVQCRLCRSPKQLHHLPVVGSPIVFQFCRTWLGIECKRRAADFMLCIYIVKMNTFFQYFGCCSCSSSLSTMANPNGHVYV